jgi:hypothetical protein
MASAKKDNKDRSTQCKRIKLKKIDPLLQQLQLLNKKKVLVKKMRMTRTKRLS